MTFKVNRKLHLILCILFLGSAQLMSASLERGKIPSDKDLLNALSSDNPDLKNIILLHESDQSSAALDGLINHLKNKASGRYYFNWKNFDKRFSTYRSHYSKEFQKHQKLAGYHMSTFPPETSWKLPFKDLKGRDVTAYELRHLSRQQKSADMTLMYFYENENRKYFDYFVKQVADLNKAYTDGEYDDAGNGVYEYYRAGRRMHNWLFNHHAYLHSTEYSNEHQLLLLKTFISHGLELQWRTRKNKYGNHHTKGLVALFEIATLFPEFSIAEKWRKQAIKGLTWHITHEINPDGFQFERSVHYHMGDIENYFRVYQLAHINRIDLPSEFTQQFRKMFEAMVKLAQPNRRLPVLQDDTDTPYDVNNNVSGVMTIGTLLFKDPGFRYFAGNKISKSIYWLLREEQLNILDNVAADKPDIPSASLKQTGYFTMRDGWEKDNLCLTVSAGLSDKKPDHQHGDMLGIVAYANGHEILPNYQVRYKHQEYQAFKNSWVKNVALVDSITLGRKWKANRGKSGFGKWGYLPEPKVSNWLSEKSFDYFCGTHNGFDTIDVDYKREILFLKNKYWLVIDHFKARGNHNFQQVWQGHYSKENNIDFIKVYSDNSGLLIRQLIPVSYKNRNGSFRNKIQNTVISYRTKNDFTFYTLLIPFNNQKELNDLLSESGFTAGDTWEIDGLVFNINPDEMSLCLQESANRFFFHKRKISTAKMNIVFDDKSSVRLRESQEGNHFTLLGYSKVNIDIYDLDKKLLQSEVLIPGKTISVLYKKIN